MECTTPGHLVLVRASCNLSPLTQIRRRSLLSHPTEAMRTPALRLFLAEIKPVCDAVACMLMRHAPDLHAAMKAIADFIPSHLRCVFFERAVCLCMHVVMRAQRA